MADNAQIEIDILVKAQEASKELSTVDKALISLADEASKAGHDFEDLTADIDVAAKQIAAQLGVSFKEAKQSLQKFKKGMDETADNAVAIDGLEGLKDKTGELDSSLKGLGGAVGLVSPEMERLLFVTGELSGGIEASSRLTMLAGGNFKSMLRIGGALGVGIAALGGAYMLMSRKIKHAEEKLKESHEAMLEGIAFAKQYRNQIHGLENSVGLLADEEFALIDARQRSNDFMKEEIEGQQAQRIVVNQITNEIERLRGQFVNFAEEQKLIPGINDEFTISMFNVADAIEKTNEQLEAGEAVLADNGRETETFSTAQLSVSEAMEMVGDNIESLEGSLARYQKEIGATERKTSRLNLLMQIQAAQAREDNAAIRSLALSMSLLDDAEASLAVASLNAARNIAIMQTQMLGLGPATGAAIAQIEKMFDRLIDDAAPSAFVETFAKLKVSAEDATGAIDGTTKATDEGVDAENEALRLAQLRAQALDMLADAQGELAVIDRDYAKAREEIIKLDQELGLTTEEMTTLFQGAMEKRDTAIEEFTQTQRDAFETQKALATEAVALELTKAEAIETEYQKQLDDLRAFHEQKLVTDEEFAAKETQLEEQKNDKLKGLRAQQANDAIATGQMITGAFQALVQSQVELITTELDAEKARAIEAAGEDQDKIAKIEDEFQKRRKKELAASFKKQKALEVAGALASAASASVAALSLPPVGLGPVLGLGLLPIIAATAATQLATIKAQQPTFHDGGIVDGSAGADVPITAQQGEVVLSRDAVASLGGPAQANALNASSGQQGPLVIEMTYRQKVFDRVVVDSLAKGGPLKSALNSAANAGRRGRIGGRL